MTVQELIDELQAIQDKDTPILITGFDCIEQKSFEYEVDFAVNDDGRVTIH